MPKHNTPNTKKESTLTSLYDKFAGIPIEVLRNPKISMGAKMVLTELISYSWFDKKAWPGQERMMFELGIKNRKTIRKYLNELKKLGLLTWEQENFQGTNHYTLLRVPANLVEQHNEYEENLKKYRESGGNLEKPWLLEKGDQKMVHHVGQKVVPHVYQKTTPKVNEDDLNEAGLNEVFHKGQIASQLSQELQPSQPDLALETNSLAMNQSLPELGTDALPEHFDLEVCNESLATSSLPLNKSFTSSASEDSSGIEHNFYSNNVENAKRLYKNGKITKDALEGWVTFLDVFEERTGRPHPRYKTDQIVRGCQEMDKLKLDWNETITYWFKNKPSKDYHFNSFATDKTLKILSLELV